MRGRFRLIFLGAILSCVGCSDEDINATLLSSQVERLLSGQLGTKSWDQVVNSTNCVDSSFLLIQTASDSLDISSITRSGSCAGFDTLLIGRAAVSAASNDFFTDSLLFATGNFWIVNELTAKRLTLQVVESQVRYEVD